MATFKDFLRQHGDGARLRRLYWVFGEEEMFRLHVVRRIKELSGVQQFNLSHLSLIETPESEIWAALNQHPLDSDQMRVLVIHEAQKLVHLERLVDWVKDNQTVRGRNTTAVFVSSEAEWEHEVRETIGKSSAALYVKCTLPKEEDARLKRGTEILSHLSGCSPVMAGVLLKRVNFNMNEAFAVLEKASLFPDHTLTATAIEALAPRRVEEDIVWSILALNKRRAIEAVVEGESVANPSQIIGTLGTHIENLSMIHDVLTPGITIREVSRRTHLNEQYVRKLFPHARLYPRKETVRRTLLLGRMDMSLNRGAKEGVLEAIISLW